MSKQRSKKGSEENGSSRRRYAEEFKTEAAPMLLDGHAAASV
jgi:hypothetical protein